MFACPGSETLQHFLNRNLPEAAEEAILAHLDGCAGCLRALEALTSCPPAARPVPALPPVATEPGADFWQRLMAAPVEPAPGRPRPVSSSTDSRSTIDAGGPVAPPSLPANVGPYRVLRTIGEGGMGIVYEAEQAHPRRRVALKVIRAAAVSPALVKRFTNEAQILGRLQHPGIAQVYDGGLDDDGQPFFAMEYIRGVPLDEYAHGQRLDLAARLDLLARVCDAVQHAHDKGVVHRDLKPGNILVDETGQPKVLDFGVARATDAGLRMTTHRTEAGQLIGTLDYMSPEQVMADPAALDSRTDVYSLGVMLYELLADRRPYRLTELPLLEVARVILTEEPPRLGAVNARFRGDVETIVAKAMEKDKARRYPSAAALAADLRRYLSHEPIQARPASALYRFGKFVRRHKAFVGGLAGVVAASLLGALVSIVFAVRAEQNAAVALEEKGRADRRTEEALWQTYRANIAAASGALQLQNSPAARRALEAAPEQHRNWEWRHLHSQLDGASRVLPLSNRPVRSVVLSSSGQQLAACCEGENQVYLFDPAYR